MKPSLLALMAFSDVGKTVSSEGLNDDDIVFFLFSFRLTRCCWGGKPRCTTCTRARACTHTRTSYLRAKGCKRRYFGPGLTIHLFFVPSEGFLFQLWLVLISAWSAGQAGTYAYQLRHRSCPEALTATNCALVVLTLRTPVWQGAA